MRINVEKQSVKDWLAALDGASRGSHYGKLWKRVYSLSAVPSRRRTSINLYKIDKNSKEGDNVVVPGKVLSTGPITHSFSISAIEFSAEALRMLKDANCKVVDIKDMVKADKVHVIV
jgi:large subunit ribosomal protein L18e